MQAVVEAQPVSCPKCHRENQAGTARCRVCDAALLGPPGVRITGIDVSIGQLMLLIVKFAIAALPLVIFCGIVGEACSVLTGRK